MYFSGFMNFITVYSNKLRSHWLSLSYKQKIFATLTIIIVSSQIILFHVFDQFMPHDVDLQHNLYSASIANYSGEYPITSIWPGLDVKTHFRYPPIYQIVVTLFYYIIGDWGMSAWLLQLITWIFVPIILMILIYNIDKNYIFIPVILLGFNRILIGVFGWQTQTPELMSLALFWLALIYQKKENWGYVSIILAIVGMTQPRFLFWGFGIFIPLFIKGPINKFIYPILSITPIILWRIFVISHPDPSVSQESFHLIESLFHNYGIISISLGIIGFYIILKHNEPILWAVIYFFLLFLINPLLDNYLSFIEPVLQLREGFNMFLPILIIIGAN